MANFLGETNMPDLGVKGIEPDTYYNIKASNGQFLNLQDQSYSIGAAVVLGDYPSLGSAQFRFVHGEQKAYPTVALVSRHSGKTMFIDGYYGE